MEKIIEAKPEEAPTPEVPTQSAQSAGDGTPLPPTPRETPAPEKTSKPKIKLAVLGLALLLFAGLTTALIAVAYSGTELPLISKETSFQLQKTYASLPLVPKAPRHILLQSLESSLEIETFTFDASLSMQEFDIALYGSAEIKTDTGNFDLHFAARNSAFTSSFTFETDLRGLGKVFYFKIKTLSGALVSGLGIDLTSVIGEWWRYDLTPLETQAREALEEEQEGTAKTVTEQAQQKAIEIFSRPGIIEAVTQKDDEKIGEEMSYHLYIAPTKEVFIKLVEALQEKSLSDSEKENIGESFEEIEKLEIDLWIGKDTSIVRKIKFLFKAKPAIQGIGTSPYTTSISLLGMDTVEGAFVLEIPKINAPVSITAPEGARDVEELLQLLYDPQQQSLSEVLGEQTKLLLERR